MQTLEIIETWSVVLTELESTRQLSIDFYASFALHHRKIDVIPFRLEQITILQSALFLCSVALCVCLSTVELSISNVRTMFATMSNVFGKYGENGTKLK